MLRKVRSFYTRGGNDTATMQTTITTSFQTQWKSRDSHSWEGIHSLLPQVVRKQHCVHHIYTQLLHTDDSNAIITVLAMW